MKVLKERIMKRKDIKKRSNALLQPFVNLKSNTMKNTMQRYGFLWDLQILDEKNDVIKHCLRFAFVEYPFLKISFTYLCSN